MVDDLSNFDFGILELKEDVEHLEHGQHHVEKEIKSNDVGAVVVFPKNRQSNRYQNEIRHKHNRSQNLEVFIELRLCLVKLGFEHRPSILIDACSQLNKVQSQSSYHEPELSMVKVDFTSLRNSICSSNGVDFA